MHLVGAFGALSCVSTNDSSVSRWIWTNESASHCLQESSGVVVEAVVRLQINLLYRELPHVPQLEGRTATFHPVLWYEVSKENNFSQSTTTTGPALQRSNISSDMATVG